MPVVVKYPFKRLRKVSLVALGMLLLHVSPAAAQVKKRPPVASTQATTFAALAAEAGMVFKLPPNFKELKAVNNENFSYDYAMAMPGQDFEIWLHVQSVKPDWNSYELNKEAHPLANPDSSYLEVSRAQAAALSAEPDYFIRNVSPRLLEQFKADAGKTYLINLADLPETHHYKYALIVAMEKSHTGYFTAVCLTNDKGPELFRNVNQARFSIRFK